MIGINLSDRSIESVYDLAVERFNNAKFIELGSLYGASTIYLAQKIKEKYPECIYHERARVLNLNLQPIKTSGRGTILVMSAGTSDIPVAEEAAITARFMGNEVKIIHDIGVSGLHRLLSYRESLMESSVIVVVAGMEGALPSVVGGLVDKPVIAVPTSVGYGASFQGIAAVLGMLNSCAAGVTVVNIDNGFGAGYAASVINRQK